MSAEKGPLKGRVEKAISNISSAMGSAMNSTERLLDPRLGMPPAKQPEKNLTPRQPQQ